MQTALLNTIERAEPAKSELRGEISAKQPRWLTDAVACSVHRVRGTVKRIAFALGVPEHAVYMAADPNTPQPLKAAWIPAIVRETESFAVLDVLEAQVGRVAYQIPIARTADDVDIVREAAIAMRECGEVFNAIGTSIADGTITAKECDAADRQFAEAHAALAAAQHLMRSKVKR